MVFALLFIGAGLLFQLAAYRWPLQRVRNSNPATLLNVFALLWAGLLTAIYTTLVVPHLHVVADIPGVNNLRSIIDAANIHPLILAAASIVLVDFIAYWAHRLNHTRALWPTHAFHHSTQTMNWLAGVRESPIHYLLVTLPGTLVATIFPPESAVAMWVGILFAPVLNQHLTHSNLRVHLGILERVFVTPKYHLVHHAADRRLSNSNFGFVLTFWDRCFGTYTETRLLPDDFALGLDYNVSVPRLILGVPHSTAARESTLNQAA